jgi:hypothetical protein
MQISILDYVATLGKVVPHLPGTLTCAIHVGCCRAVHLGVSTLRLFINPEN